MSESTYVEVGRTNAEVYCHAGPRSGPRGRCGSARLKAPSVYLPTLVTLEA